MEEIPLYLEVVANGDTYSVDDLVVKEDEVEMVLLLVQQDLTKEDLRGEV